MKATRDAQDTAPFKDAVVFLVFIVFGCAYIVFGKLAGVTQALVTFLPVAIMIAYALMIWFGRGLRLRDDQAGDNLYYMGFLFTLASLGVSLYQFSADGGAEVIVRNFGIAIASTIAGVALRVVFNQMRRDPIDVERVTRLQLADAARRVRRELDATVMEMSNFRRVTQQVIAEGYAETKGQVDAVSSKVLEGLVNLESRAAEPMQSAARTASDTLATMSGRLTTGLEDAGKRLSTEAERLTASTQGISQSLDALANRLKALQAPDQVIELKISPVVEAFGKVVADLALAQKQQAGATLQAMANLRMSATALSDGLSQMKAATDEQRSHVLDASRALSRGAEDTGATVARLEKAVDAMGRVHEAMTSSLDPKLNDIRRLLEESGKERIAADYAARAPLERHLARIAEMLEPIASELTERRRAAGHPGAVA